MTHPMDPHAGSAAGGHCPPVQGPFSLDEVDTFRAEDRTAARHIVGLLLSIFVLGVVGYTAVALWCNGSI